MSRYRLPRRGLAVAAGLIALVSLSALAFWDPAALPEVYVNGVRLSPEQIRFGERATGMILQGGQYWYDGKTGEWGVAGGPALGHIPPFAGPGDWTQLAAADRHPAAPMRWH